MIGTIVLRSLPSVSSPSSILSESIDLQRSRSARSGMVVVCSAPKGNDSGIPKLEPFSRSRFERGMKEPSFIQKSENELTDYCCMLEGDESYSCWRAYFELKDLEKELPKDDVEKLLREAGGKKSLIDCLHGITAMQEMDEKRSGKKSPVEPAATERRERPFPIPDGLPKTKEELEEEDNARMPDSPFTRLLRSKGTHPAWYTEVPDHETD